MGMASSQARLLHLTSRMHQIEYKAAKLEAEKLQMANESSKVYDTYLEALERQKIAVSVMGADGAMTKTDLTANLIYNYGNLGEQYALVTKDDKTLISSSLHTKYQNTNSLKDFLADLGLNDTYTQTIHHSDPNPAYQAAVTNYNNDTADWNQRNTNYTNYLNEEATYQQRLAEWGPKHNAYVQYQTDLSNYNRDLATWQTKKNARTQYESDYANWQTEHAAWETRNQSFTDYEALHDQWVIDHADWVTRNNKYQTYQSQKVVHDQWVIDKAAYDQYLLDQDAYDQWITEDPKLVKEDKTQVWWTVLETGVGREGLDEDFLTAASKTCYGLALTGTVSCYNHVLSHMLDYDGSSSTYSGEKYTTSLGDETGKVYYGGGCHNKEMTDVNGNATNTNVIFKEVSDVVNSGVLVNVMGETYTPATTKYEKLLSKFNTDGSVKTLKQWVIDLLYICEKTGSIEGYPLKEDGTPNNKAFGATIEKIQSSLAASLYNFNEVLYTQILTDWENDPRGIAPTPVPDPGAEPPLVYADPPGTEPIEPTPVTNPGTEPPEPPFVADPGAPPQAPPVVADPGPAPTAPTPVSGPGPQPVLENYINGISPTNEWDEIVTHATFTDKALTQWYVNVWCKMEGLNETPIVSEMIVHDDATNTDKAIYSVQDMNKSITTYGTNPFSNAIENDNYIVIKDSDLNDNNWITNTVQNGEVLIQSWSKSKGGFVDTSVAANVHLNYVDNNIDLKKAEAQYEADMLKIDRKDRRYDTELARLENERNAINQEMDTLKTVAKENVDRTFKLFS